jgi:EAL domain-containing protein (putative c-di-GMP-specific phosphodiesterase class I)
LTDYRDFYRELRTDWLKLRGYLYDSNALLPSLPTVIDGVRRRLEDGEGVGLVYLDPSGGGHLETSYGWQAYDELIGEVARELREFHVAELTRHDAVALSGVRSDEFLLFAGLDGNPAARLETLRQGVVSRIQASLGRLEGELYQVVQLDSAAVPLRLEPAMRIERAIYHSLQTARAQCRRQSDRRHSRRLGELRRILREGELLVRYQPIVDLRDGVIHGFEALSSAATEEFFESPEMLFAFAEESEVILELERLCRREAARRVTPLLGRPGGPGAGGKLFVNCSAHAFADRRLRDDLIDCALGAGLDPSDVVVEVTERTAVTEWRVFRRALRELRRAGLKIAIDDVGSGYSSLHAVAQIEPDYLKLDSSLIQDVHRSSIKRDLLETLVLLARKIGARSIAEGIEKAEELDAVRRLGVRYGQGYYLATPALPDRLGPVRWS